MGDPNASIPTPQPVFIRPMFGAFPSVLNQNCFAFISAASQPNVKQYKLKKKLGIVQGCRTVTKKDMKLNSYTPSIQVDPETYKVICDGKHIYCKPSDTIPMTQSVFLC